MADATIESYPPSWGWKTAAHAGKRILTGMRPTGPLHLGHYVGALENWVRSQDEYDCYFLIADYQALGDHIDDISLIRDSVIAVATDWLSVGLDPERSTFVIQSYVPEHAELTMLLSMIAPLGMLQRNPTLKAEMAELKSESLSVGFFNYPMSQVADILLPKANLVPVGDDQAPHIELTREIARKFNRLFDPIFPEPETMIGRVPRLRGVDGKAKMSKSIGNVILLSDDAETVRKRVMSMYTDPTRIHATDPGHVEGNPLFEYHDAFNTDRVQVEDFKQRYRAGKVGDVEVKKALVTAINEFLDPIRERRAMYEQEPRLVEDALMAGTQRAKKTAAETMAEVRSAMQIDSYTATRG